MSLAWTAVACAAGVAAAFCFACSRAASFFLELFGCGDGDDD